MRKTLRPRMIAVPVDEQKTPGLYGPASNNFYSFATER
jgi:hypothetical protein